MNGQLESYGQTFLYYHGQVTYQELLLKAIEFSLADKTALLQIPIDLQCESSTRVCHIPLITSFLPLTPNTNMKGSA